MMKNHVVAVIALAVAATAFARDEEHKGGEAAIAAQNAALEKSTDGKGYGPQSPRDLSMTRGTNKRIFAKAPSYKEMNLCNIHFHKNAEHKGGEFTTHAGHGDGHGYGTGYKYAGKLTAAESKPLDADVCASSHGGLNAGDTLELHYVHSSAQVVPGPTLNSCLSESDANPQLRVEALVMVLVNDPAAADFRALAKTAEINGYQQAPNIPATMGKPIEYAGSTTGPAYNEKGSPLQVSWSVRPRVLKVNAASVGEWCKSNVFKEDHAHGVRNLVINEKLLSRIR